LWQAGVLFFQEKSTERIIKDEIPASSALAGQAWKTGISQDAGAEIPDQVVNDKKVELRSGRARG
jgi:hypothetical protein